MRIGDQQNRRPWLVSLLSLLLWVWSAPSASAQLPTGTILGAVRDASGGIMPGADVNVRNVNTGLSRTSVSGENGSYRFPALPVGDYEVRAELSGFRTQLRTGLNLTVGQEIVVNLTLEVGSVSETVAVSAEAPLVNTTSGSLGGLVDEQRIAELPLNGRNYVELTLLQMGVQQHKSMNLVGGLSGIWYSSNGAPMRSNNLMLDGAPMQNLFGATSSSISGSTLGVEGIQEYRVVTNSFSAEYGLTMGSQMTLVSKSGTNLVHGSLFEYHRNDALDARNFFDRAPTAPAFTRNNFGGAVGGPLRQNQTFFHTTYEAVRERLGVTRISNVIPPEAKVDGGLVPRISPLIKPILALFPDPNLPNNQFTFSFTEPTTEDYWQGRLDHNFSADDTFFARYTIHDANRLQVRDYPDFTTEGYSRSQYATLSENHIFSSALLNTARFSYSRTTIRYDSSGAPSGPGFTFVPGKDMPPLTIGGVTTLGPDATTPTHFKQNIFTFSDDLFYSRGTHSLKFGALVNWYQQYMLNSAGVRGAANFPNIAAFLEARPSTYSANQGIVDRTYHYSTVGTYVQDDWQARSNLTLNLGLRYEFATELREARGLGAALRDIRNDAQTTPGPNFKNPSLRNFSPRFGFAWDVMGDGRTAVRGGFGRLYDIGNLGSALLIGGLNPPHSPRSSVAGPAAAQLFAIPLFFPSTAAARSARLMDYNMEQPHMHQFNLTVERQLPASMAVTLAYAGSRGMNLTKTEEGNPTIPQVLSDGRQFWTGTERRVNPNFDSIDLRTAKGNSWYDALQFGLIKRLTHGVQFQSSYTWSKTIDDSQGQLNNEINSSSIFGTDPLHPEVDRGPASFDVEHNWRFNAIYHLPQVSSAGGVGGALLNGWWISSIVSMQSGYPFTPVLASNRSRSGVNGGAAGIDRPDLMPGVEARDITRGVSRGCVVAGRGIPAGTPVGTPQLWFDPCAFTIPQAGFLGTAGRNSLRGPGFATVDFSLAKDTEVQFLGGAKQLQFRAEVFNILNRVNLALPSGSVFAAQQDVEAPLPNAGVITRTASTARQVQFAVKFLF